MSDRYILAEDGRTPVLCPDFLTWARWFESSSTVEGNAERPKSPRQTAEDEIDGVRVSTVFLGLDHQFGSGPPILWETMIFGGEHDDHCDRYSSHEDAIAGHAKAVALVKGEP